MPNSAQKAEISAAGGLKAWFRLRAERRRREGLSALPARIPNPKPGIQRTIYQRFINEACPWGMRQYPGRIVMFAFFAGIQKTTAARILFHAPHKYQSRPVLRRLISFAELKATAWASIAAELRQVLASRERSSRNPAAERRRTKDPAYTAPAKNHTAPANEPSAVQRK